MNIFFLIGFCVLAYTSLIIGCKFWKSSILYTLAIGSIVNANIFHSQAYPIYIFGLKFGMNSVVYTLFLVCVIIMYIDFGKSDAYKLVICSVSAVIFATIVEFLTKIASFGYNVQYLKDSFLYFSSCISSIVASILIVKLYNIFKNKKFNFYLNITLSLIISSIIDSIIYYGLSLVTNISLMSKDFWLSLLALYIGKLISIAFAIFSLYFLKKFCNTDSNNSTIENK